MKKILIVCASSGNNLELANKLSDEVKAQACEFEILELSKLNLPLYSSETQKASIPKLVYVTLKQLQESRACIFLAPEYNGLIPPSLNNFIAWLSVSRDDWRAGFNNKICAIGTHSGGGGVHVLVAMRQQLSFLGCNVLGREILTNFSKELNPKTATAVVCELLSLSKT